MRRRILVVARDVALRAELARLLMDVGYLVDIAEGDRHAREVLAGGDVRIALLAPEGINSGGALLMRELDEREVKIILLSKRPGEIDPEMRPPLASAITLPLDRQLVLSKVATVLDAVTAAEPTLEIARFDGLTLDIRCRSAFDATDREIALTRLEFALLAVFARQPGRALSRDELLQAVSGRNADRYDRSIDVLVTRLRRKIELDPKKPRFIVTLPGVGYKFAAKPKIVDQQVTASNVDSGLITPRPPTAERRQLTVLSCAFPELATLSTRLDPEDLQGVLTDYRQCSEQVAANLAGSLAGVLNDGAVIYFGHPKANEDDAERAVRAGLDLLDRLVRHGVDRTDSSHPRIGIATGLVLVRAGGDGVTSDEIVAVGEAPNLAARLRSAATPGTVMIDASTRRLVGNMFETRGLDLAPVDGFPSPIPAWEVTGQSSGISRFEALRAPSLSPLVGREEEIELLLRRWNRVIAGDGQVVLISGEAGIGKSRITVALREQLGDLSYVPMGYFCSAHHSGSPFYPIVRQIERAAGFSPDDGVGIRLGKLSDLLGPLASPANVAVLGELLSLPPIGPSVGIERLSPQRKREETLQALIRLIESGVQRQPMLITFEDVQWIDPTSRELLDLMIDRIRRLPVLLLVTFRPEFQAPWSGQSHVTMLTLNRLNPRDAAALATRIAGDVALPSDMIAEIVKRTDGIPLFVEELTRAILENGRWSGSIASLLSTSPSPLGVPETLHSSLMARLDRLGPVAKEVAQRGAVLGREFSYEPLQTIWKSNEADLKEALERLSEAGILWSRGTPPFSHYAFKHALLQEAAYGTLLRRTRQLLHSQAADALISRSEKDASARAEVIAHHLQFAGRSGEAITYWRKAGERAVQQAANREAVGHLRRALSLLEVQPETAGRRRAELAILLQLGPALMSLHGWWASEVGETIERASRVARGLKSSAELAPSIANLWSFNIARGRYDRAEENSRDLFRIARELDDPEILLQAHHTAQGNLVLRGEFAAASEHIDAALLLYDAERHAHHRYLYLGHDPGVCMLALSAMMQSMLGYPSAAVRREGEALIAGRGLGHAPSLAQALWFACESQTARGDAPAVLDTATELLELSDEHGLLQLRSFALIFLGWALARSGETSEGIARLVEGLSASTKMGGRMLMTRSLCLMAESLLSAGRYAEGLEQVTRAFDIAAQLGEQWNLSRLHRVHAELLLQVSGPNDKKAEASLHQALAVARRQGARDGELRAATSLARLWVDHGRHIDARRLLAPLCARLANEIDAPDLGEATELFDSLG